MFKIKIRRGTVAGTGNLCETCSYAGIVQGDNARQRFQRCSRMDRDIPFEVRECTLYFEKHKTSLADMYEMSWVIQTDKDAKQIGFVRYKDMETRDQERLAREIGF